MEQPDTAQPPPPTEAQEPRLRDELIAMRNLLASYQSDKYNQGAISYLDYAIEKAETYERKRLAAEARVKDLETTVAGQKLYIASCHIGIDNTLNELATLRTRLERAEEALRAMLKLLTDAEDAGFDLYRISILVTRLRALLPPSPGAVEAGGEEGGGA